MGNSQVMLVEILRFVSPDFRKSYSVVPLHLKSARLNFRKELSVEDEVVVGGSFKADSLTRRASE